MLQAPIAGLRAHRNAPVLGQGGRNRDVRSGSWPRENSNGQNRESSMRANVFRFAPESGHRAMQSACPFRANRRHRACTPLANFLSEDLAFTRKGQSEHNFSCWRAIRLPLDAVIASAADE